MKKNALAILFVVMGIVGLLLFAESSTAQTALSAVPVWDVASEPSSGCGAYLPRSEQRRTPQKIPIALTINGGASLGSYEAGYLYYLTEFLKHNADVFETQIITGASAGTLNALMTLLSLANGESIEVTDSLFFRIWTSNELTYDHLMDIGKEKTLRGALSSRKAFTRLVQEVENVWNAGIKKGQVYYVGVSTTKLVSHKIELENGYRVMRQEEKFVFSVTGQGPGVPPVVENFKVLDDALKPPRLNFGEHRPHFKVIRDLAYASSAFPLAFRPKRLETLGEKDGELIVSSYLDGGVLDNYPLRLAYNISQKIYAPGVGRAAETPVDIHLADARFETCTRCLSGHPEYTARQRAEICLGQGSGSAPESDVQLLFLNPMNTSYSGLNPSAENEPLPVDFFDYVARTIGGFVDAARAKEAYALAEENTDVMQNMLVSERSLPLASNHMLNFMGFFDQNFRIFDFFVGMYDGYRFASQDLTAMVTRQRGQMADHVAVPLLVPGQHRDFSEVKRPTWGPFYCIRSVIENEPELGEHCHASDSTSPVDGIDMHNFNTLLQVALFQLYNHCREVAKSGFKGQRTADHCRRAMRMEPPPRITPAARDENGPLGNDRWQRRKKEVTFDYFVRLLVASNYYFRELEIPKTDAEEVRVRIRNLLSYYISAYANTLNEGRTVLKVMGKPLLNRISPPKIISYFVVGLGAELALSTVSRTQWLRWNFALQGKGISSIGSSVNRYATFGLVLGPEFDLNYKWRSPFIQFRLMLPRIGYQTVLPHKAFTKRECAEASGVSAPKNYCSGMIFQAALAVSFYERVRFQIGVTYIPEGIGDLGPDESDWSWISEIGWQFLPSSLTPEF